MNSNLLFENTSRNSLIDKVQVSDVWYGVGLFSDDREILDVRHTIV